MTIFFVDYQRLTILIRFQTASTKRCARSYPGGLGRPENDLQMVGVPHLCLVGGFKHEFYFPFHIWDVILPRVLVRSGPSLLSPFFHRPSGFPVEEPAGPLVRTFVFLGVCSLLLTQLNNALWSTTIQQLSLAAPFL